MYSRSKHWHLIDDVLVHERDLKDVIHTKVMPSAECHTNYHRVRCKLRLHFKPKPRKGGPSKKKVNLNKLQSAESWLSGRHTVQLSKQQLPRRHFWKTLGSTEECHPADIWRGSGFTTKKNENNQEIQGLLAKKRSSHQAHLVQPSCPVRSICSILQRKLREIHTEWWTNLAKRTQQYANLGDYRGFYKALKAVYSLTHRVQSPFHSTNGQVLFTDKASILRRWFEHFF